MKRIARNEWILLSLIATAILLLVATVAESLREARLPRKSENVSRQGAGQSLSQEEIRKADLSLNEAMFYEETPEAGQNAVRCLLCPTMCTLRDGERGVCRVRMNLGGKLRTLVYGKPLSLAVDPIEKKPLFHVLPGAAAFSLATAGCNLGCLFCQNWEISQAYPEKAPHYNVSPEKLVALAEENGCKTIAYTYTEPTVYFEYMYDTAKVARAKGIKNLWITAGYINPQPLRELCKYLDAANVDLKGFSEEFYRKYCFARLKPVLETLKILKEEDVFFEITNLVIPDVNDDPDMIRQMCKWIVTNLGPETPLHFSRFFPHYKMRNKPPTPAETLKRCREIARQEGLHYVFIGNIRIPGAEDTFCPKCGKLIVQRIGYYVAANEVRNGACRFCGEPIPGIWEGAEGRSPWLKPVKKD